jgi:hypothetical protein
MHIEHRELLLELQRFAVISVGARLLVLLPTAAGELLALCTRAEGDMEDLTREVVRSIMSVSGSRLVELGAQRRGVCAGAQRPAAALPLHFGTTA